MYNGLTLTSYFNVSFQAFRLVLISLHQLKYNVSTCDSKKPHVENALAEEIPREVS